MSLIRGRKEEVRFTNDDFSMLSDDALINAKILVSVIGDGTVDEQESEEFVIRFGTPPDKGTNGVGKIVGKIGEGLMRLDERDLVTATVSLTNSLPLDSKGYLILRTPQRGKSYRVFRPPLIHEIEQDWASRSGEIGRWRVKVRASGARAGVPDFLPVSSNECGGGLLWQQMWDRVANANRRMAEKFAACGGGVGQVYDQQLKSFDIVKEYMLAWTALIDGGPTALALVNTVEIQSLSGGPLV